MILILNKRPGEVYYYEKDILDFIIYFTVSFCFF